MSPLKKLTRREFTRASLAGTALLLPSGRTAADESPPHDGSIESIEHQGMFIRECSLPGETRADGVVPRHANCIQVSRDRWLIVYSTHGYRGVDDERSIVYQLRSGSPEGSLIKEGFLARALDDWRPPGVDLSMLGPNRTLFKQHGHMVVFGVPVGAKIHGRAVPHAGLFVAKWRTSGRVLDHARDDLEHSTAHPALKQNTLAVEWVQFRLNPAADDLEIVQPAGPLRQAGFEQGIAFSSAEAAWMNQSFVPAVPYNAECTEWADANHFDLGRVAALKYRFHPQRERYEWVATGPFLSAANRPLFEASLARFGHDWILAARQSGASGAAWTRTVDPFSDLPAPVFPKEPQCNSPLTAFTCGDGVLRLFTGDGTQSPYRNGRDPLYCWDVDPDHGFACHHRRVLFDSVKAGLPIRHEVWPKIDFCQLFPPHGRTQLVVHGVSTRGYNHPYVGRKDIPPINATEKEVSAVYYARITYREPARSVWQF